MESSEHGYFVALDGSSSLYVEDEGTGTPIIFVHGLPGLGRDFRPLTSALRHTHRCITYDRAGYGLSNTQSHPVAIGLDASVSDLLALTSYVAETPACVVGWSYGGPIALNAAIRAPERIDSVVLLGSAGPALDWPSGPVNRLLFSSVGERLLKALLSLGPSAFRPALDTAYGARAPDEVVRNFYAAISQPGAIRRWVSEGRAWAPCTTVPESVEQRCLVIHGDRDQQVPVFVGVDLAERLPEAEWIQLKGCGHWPFATHSSEVASAIQRFLAEQAP